MENSESNKKKIFNDPIYGFITLPYDILLDIIDHPYFQRLRRIQQLGLTHMVYPGALHTRFHHAIGATYLMGLAVESLRAKGVEITEEESIGVHLAILLHDIGHGPYSHALEHSIVKNVDHEQLSILFMEELNKEFDGKLSLAIQIFKGEYQKNFLHELVSSQLDMDRLDYLKRDSFYSGVSEGVVGNQRIISMLSVKDDKLCVLAKGIYSIEKFLVARRLMYWQVYFHKTVVSSEFMVVNMLNRARELAAKGVELWCTPQLKYFLYNDISWANFEEKPTEMLNHFAGIDDYDILTAIKVWQDVDDKILAEICSNIANRKLWKVEVQKTDFPAQKKDTVKQIIAHQYNIDIKEAEHFIIDVAISNNAYIKNDTNNIPILYRNGKTLDMAEASDNLNISALSDPVTKHFLCYPKSLQL